MYNKYFAFRHVSWCDKYLRLGTFLRLIAVLNVVVGQKNVREGRKVNDEVVPSIEFNNESKESVLRC